LKKIKDARPTKQKPNNLLGLVNPYNIKEAAYYKWHNRGRQEGSAIDDWLEAERHLQGHIFGYTEPVERNLESMSISQGDPFYMRKQEQGSQ
jgi:hypothetical protein